MMPSVTEASASLENAMNRMGLDVIGSVTFGALSEGEMRLAMDTAVPRGLALLGVGGVHVEELRLHAGVGKDLRPWIDNYVQFVSGTQFRLADGTLARNRPLPESLWLDDLYMSVPCLAQAGKLTGDVRYFDDAAKQILQFSERMFVKERGLFMHGWVQGMQPHPMFPWARANGWAMMAMVELLEVLPENHAARGRVLEIYRTHAAGLAADVLDPAVELAEQAVLGPGEVRGSDESPVLVEHVDFVPFEVGTATGASLFGKHMVVTSWKSFSIYDVSNPEAPERLSTMPFLGNDGNPSPIKFENEDVATNGRIMIFSEELPGDVLHVWDIQSLDNPVEIAAADGLGGHTASCILDCKYVISSDGHIIDLRRPEGRDMALELIRGADVVIDTAGGAATLKAGMDMLRPGGRLSPLAFRCDPLRRVVLLLQRSSPRDAEQEMRRGSGNGLPLRDEARRLSFEQRHPAAEEDRQDKPFVGKSGQLLDRMLAANQQFTSA